MTLLGADVSSNNGHVDWDAYARSGRRFGFTKLTEGVSYPNPSGNDATLLAHNRAEMHRVGLVVVGLYHFARPGVNSAATEAQHFLDHLGTLQPGEVCVLDFESNDHGLSKVDLGTWARTWLAIVAQSTGREPGLYSYGPFLDGMDLTGLPERSWLWIAGYGPEPKPRAWPRWTFWQYTDKAGVPGISNPSDDSKFYGDEAALAALAGATTGGTFMAALTDQEQHNLAQRVTNIEGAVARLEQAWDAPITYDGENVGIEWLLKNGIRHITQKVDALSTGGGSIDYAALAKAVADELERRLAS